MIDEHQWEKIYSDAFIGSECFVTPEAFGRPEGVGVYAVCLQGQRSTTLMMATESGAYVHAVRYEFEGLGWTEPIPGALHCETPASVTPSWGYMPDEFDEAIRESTRQRIAVGAARR